MKLKRFHINVGFPNNYNLLLDKYLEYLSRSRIRVSKHFSDKLGMYIPFRDRILDLVKHHLSIKEENIFEIYTNNEITRLEKVCCRFIWDSLNDIIIVLTKDGSLVTFYFNSKINTHRDLQKELYEEILK